jgi:hypothetical protein
VQNKHETGRLIGLAVQAMIKSLLPKSLCASKNTIELKVVGHIVVGKSFHSFVGTEHLDELQFPSCALFPLLV